MNNKITLPEAEETQVEIVIGEESKTIDLIDFIDVWMETVRENSNLGGTTSTIVDVFIVKAKEGLDLELSKTSATQLLGYLFEEESKLKKKLFELLGWSDSTDSQSNQQNETSDSSKVSNQTSKQKN